MDEKKLYKYLHMFYKIIWIPLRVIGYTLSYFHIWFYVRLWNEDCKNHDNDIKKWILLINIPICVHYLLLTHISMYWTPSEKVKKPKFKPLNERFSKEEIAKMKPDLVKLLSYSHCTEDDYVKFLKENGRESELRHCDKCKDIKPFSMSHCSSCRTWIYRMDHHCPWANKCVSIHTNHIFLSFLGFTLIFLPLQWYLLKLYSDTESYQVKKWTLGISYWFITFWLQSGTGYIFIESYINFKGRAFVEMLRQMSRGPQPAKFKLDITWRDYYFIYYGTYNIYYSYLFPYLAPGSPITGLEYSFLERSKENDTFLDDHFKMAREFLKKYFKLKDE